MYYLLVELIAPIITGCVVACFVSWLDDRNEE